MRQHAAEFLQRLEDEGEEVPAHVRGELLRFLDWGVLGNGFVRVWCERCKDDLLVAFSCKGRGICPSCGGRRMADTAAPARSQRSQNHRRRPEAGVVWGSFPMNRYARQPPPRWA